MGKTGFALNSETLEFSWRMAKLWSTILRESDLGTFRIRTLVAVPYPCADLPSSLVLFWGILIVVRFIPCAIYYNIYYLHNHFG